MAVQVNPSAGMTPDGKPGDDTRSNQKQPKQRPEIDAKAARVTEAAKLDQVFAVDIKPVDSSDLLSQRDVAGGHCAYRCKTCCCTLCK